MTSQMPKTRLAMVVMNDITGDSRVKKSAISALRLGFEVEVFGIARDRPWSSTMQGVPLHRVASAPLARPPLIARRNGSLRLDPLAAFGFATEADLEAARVRRADRTGGRFGRIGRIASDTVFRIRRKGLTGTSFASWGRLRDRFGRQTPSPAAWLGRRLPGLVRPTDALVDAISAFGPDLIHAHDITALQVPPIYNERADRPVPWIYDAHEWVAGIQAGDAARTLAMVEMERRFAPDANGVVCVSEPLADILVDSVGLTVRPRLVLNAPPRRTDDGPAIATIRVALGLAPELSLIVYPGVVKPLRGLETIVAAIARSPGVHLALVTDPDGPHVRELVEMSNQLGCRDRLHVHAYVSASQVSEFMSDATLGVHPLRHYPNAEIALPTKLFEFLHAGIPAVLSDVAEMSRFVNDHGTGVTFAAGDVAACARAITSALDRRADLVSKITAELVAHHSWEVQENRLRDAYAEALGEAVASPDTDVPFDLIERTSRS